MPFKNKTVRARACWRIRNCRDSQKRGKGKPTCHFPSSVYSLPSLGVFTFRIVLNRILHKSSLLAPMESRRTRRPTFTAEERLERRRALLYWGPRTVHHYERGSATLSMLCATHHYQCQCAWFSMLKCTVWAIRDGFRARSPRSGTCLGPEKPGRSFCAGSAVTQLTSVEDYTTYNFVITTPVAQSRLSRTRSCTTRAVQ